MSFPLFLLGFIGVAGGSVALLMARRVFRRQGISADQEESRSFATFRSALEPLGVSDRVARVVYDYFATREHVTGTSRPPRSTDELWGDHLISEPEELADVRGTLLIALGYSTDLNPPSSGELCTVVDLAVWLEHEMGEHPVKWVETPLGNIKFEAAVHGRADVKMLELPRTLQNGMTLDRVVACMLVVEPSVDGAALSFSAQLDNEGLAGSPESGEYLDGVSWESSDWVLSLGTEDTDALSQRLKCLEVESGTCPIAYSRSGLELRLTGLKRDTALSFHFIVAYKRLPDDRECSTWFAVDVPHEIINKSAHEPNV